VQRQPSPLVGSRGCLNRIGPGYSRRPRLVSGVDYTRKPPFTLTYHIRPEARWSDGTPLTARDFVFTHQARLEHPRLEDDPHKTYVRSVREVNAKTVRVVLRSRFFFWREALFDVVLPRHALRGEDLEQVWRDRVDNPKTGEPIGSGPFLVGPWERGKQLTLVRNPRYWGPHRAYLDRIVVRFAAPLDPEFAICSEVDRSTSSRGSTRRSSRPRCVGFLESGSSSHPMRRAGSTSTSGSARAVIRR